MEVGTLVCCILKNLYLASVHVRKNSSQSSKGWKVRLQYNTLCNPFLYHSVASDLRPPAQRRVAALLCVCACVCVCVCVCWGAWHIRIIYANN